MHYLLGLVNNNYMKRCKDFISEEEKWITPKEILYKGGNYDGQK